MVVTDAAGSYILENMKAGKYSLRAQRTGFAETVIDNITLAARQDLRITLQMSVASGATTVVVSALGADSVINTENATIGDSKVTEEISQLPINSRAATTTPLEALATSANVQQDSQGNLAIGGATSNMVGLSVDGISSVNIYQTSVALGANAAGSNPYPSSEGIAELKVTAFNNNAEFAQVADVTFTTKAGTSKYHGSLFEYLQNDALNASTYNFPVKTPQKFNTFGGSVGGPLRVPFLLKGDKTFFFFDYEGNRRSTAQAAFYTVPTALDRTGDLSDLASTIPVNPSNPNCPKTAGCLINPATGSLATGQPFASYKITTALNQSMQTLLNDYYPLPNLSTPIGPYNYEKLLPFPSVTNGFDVRVDRVINANQQVYARYNWKNLLVNVVNPLLPNDLDTEQDRSFLVSHNYLISSKLVNEFRFGFSHSIVSPDFPIEGAVAINQLGLLGIDVSHHPTDGGFPTISFSDGTNFMQIGRDHVGATQSSTDEMADNLTYTLGKHSLRGGVDVRWVRFGVPEIETPSDDYGLFTFNQNTFTGSSFGDFLLGLPNTSYFATTGPRDNTGGPQYGFYGQDEWQVNNHLTVNFGLRWELLPPFVDANGQQADFDPKTNSVILNDILYRKLGGPVLTFLQSINACNASIPGHTATADPGYAPSTAMPCTKVVSNQQEGVSTGLRQTYMRNFDPRLSIAYRPFGNDNTVVRAGFGIFTVTALGQLQNNNESDPVEAVFTYTNPSASGTPTFQFPQVRPAGAAAAIGGGEIEAATDPHYRDAQAAQWNLTVERQLTASTALRASYVGMSSYRLNVSVNWNQQPPSAVSPNPNPIPFPNWGAIFSTNNFGHQTYQALEVQGTRRMSRGVTYQANYTWAHDLSDAQGDAPTSFQGETRYGLADEDRWAINRNRGNVVGTRRNRLMLTGTAELPYGRGRQWSSKSGIVDGILGGWNLNTITLLETGPYLTPVMSASEDRTNINLAAEVTTLVRPDKVGNPIPAHRTNANYFNINAFAPPPVGSGRVGDAGVGSLEAPGTIAVNAGLAKILALRESWRLRFELTFTNVLNHTNFAAPSADISTPSSFGQLITAQSAESAGNRTGQAALRIDF